MAFALAFYTDASATLLNDGLTDGETETCSLYEVVQLDETFEDASLLLQWNTCSCVFAVEQKAAIFFAIAHADMSLMGVFDGIGDEVGEKLLQSACIEHGGVGRVWIVLLELNTRLLHTLLK